MKEVALVMWIDPKTEWLIGEEIIDNSDSTLSHISTLIDRTSSEEEEDLDDDDEYDDPHNLKDNLYHDIVPDRVDELQQYLSHKMEPEKYIYQFGIFEID